MQAGSRFLSDAERRYAMIELECLAAAWGMLKGRQFLEGLPQFTLITDHKPLVPILNEYSLDKLDNPHILRMRLKMQRIQLIREVGSRQTERRRRCPIARPGLQAIRASED